MGNDVNNSVDATLVDTSSAQAQAEAFNSFLAMPTTKLDADQYLVSDLDGVTEGLFGSGNMNFLMMQAGQTDEAIVTGNPFDLIGGNDSIQSIAPVLSTNPFAYGGQGHDGDALALRSLGDLADTAGQIEGGPGGGGTSTNASSFGASNYAANSHSQNPFSSVRNYASSSESNVTNNYPGKDGEAGPAGVSGTNGTNGTNGNSGNDGNDGNDGNNGNNGLNGLDGLDGIIDDLGPVGIDLSLFLDNITNITLDIISGDQVLNIINEIIDLSPILTPVDNLLGNIAAGVDLSVILDPFQYDNDPNDQDLTVLTDLSALGLPLLSSLDNLHVPLDLVEGLLGDLDIELDLGSEVLSNLLGGNTDDTDLGFNLSGLGLGNLPLPVLGSENILLNPVEDLLGDIDIGLTPSLNLFNTSAIDNNTGDTDIVIPLDINLLGGNLLGDAIEIDLTPVEQLLGDIDLDLSLATNLLGNVADGLIDNFDGGTGNDTILSNIGDGVSGLLSPLLPVNNGDDTDVALGLGGDLPGIDLLNNSGAILLNPVEDVLGDIDVGLTPNLDLFDTTAIDNTAGDTDISIPLDLALIDNPILNDIIPIDSIDIPLDPLEAITGDIDLDLTVAANLLGDTAGGLIDNLDGGTGTSNLLSDVGDAVSDITGSILDNADGNIFEIIPDVEAASSNLAESITQNLETVIDGAIDLLDTVVSGGNLLGGDILSNDSDFDDIGNWTESLLPEAGDLFGSGLIADITGFLPDPVSAASPIESIIPTPIVADVLDGLGLGSGRHFGGLFG